MCVLYRGIVRMASNQRVLRGVKTQVQAKMQVEAKTIRNSVFYVEVKAIGNSAFDTQMSGHHACSETIRRAVRLCGVDSEIKHEQ